MGNGSKKVRAINIGLGLNFRELVSLTAIASRNTNMICVPLPATESESHSSERGNDFRSACDWQGDRQTIDRADGGLKIGCAKNNYRPPGRHSSIEKFL